jgi:hypothetical protein
VPDLARCLEIVGPGNMSPLLGFLGHFERQEVRATLSSWIFLYFNIVILVFQKLCHNLDEVGV